MRADFMKGWFVLAKALDRMRCNKEALAELENGLRALPGCRELLDLQADLVGGGTASGVRTAAQSVSPARTPNVSRGPTPSRAEGTGGRPVSPSLAAAGASSLHHGTNYMPSAASAQTHAGHASGRHGSSRSPGASGRMPPPPPPPPPRTTGGPTLDASGTFQTGNFGAPTPSGFGGPSFHGGGGCASTTTPTTVFGEQPPPPPLPGSARKSYSPGPSRVAQTYGGPASTSPATSRSPGPHHPPNSARSGHSHGPGPDFEGTGQHGLPRKSPSLRHVLEGSHRGPSRSPGRTGH